MVESLGGNERPPIYSYEWRLIGITGWTSYPAWPLLISHAWCSIEAARLSSHNHLASVSVSLILLESVESGDVSRFGAHQVQTALLHDGWGRDLALLLAFQFQHLWPWTLARAIDIRRSRCHLADSARTRLDSSASAVEHLSSTALRQQSQHPAREQVDGCGRILRGDDAERATAFVSESSPASFSREDRQALHRLQMHPFTAARRL
jgi:hypothetical protein